VLVDVLWPDKKFTVHVDRSFPTRARAFT
jgi:hypothetical protein